MRPGSRAASTRRPGLLPMDRHAAGLVLVALQLALEDASVAVELDVERSGRQEVPDPQEHLRRVEGLHDQVVGTRPERPAAHVRRRFGRQHQDREEGVGGATGLDLFHHLKPVDLGHVQVEDHEVGVAGVDRAEDVTGIGGGQHVLVAVLAEQLAERHERGLVVVDDADPTPVDVNHRHASGATRGAAKRGTPSARRSRTWRLLRTGANACRFSG